MKTSIALILLTALVLQVAQVNTMPVDKYDFGADIDLIQQAMNGFYEECKLPDPKTISTCIDPKTSSQIVAFLPSVLDQACHISLGNIQQLVTLVKNFIDGLDPAVGKCLDGNAEVAALEKYFGFPLDTSKIISYITFHFGSIQKSICAMQNTQKSGDYKGLGTQAGVLAKTIIGIKAEGQLQMVGADIDLIQQAMNGFYEECKLQDPKTIATCIDPKTSSQVIVFLPSLLDQACHISLGNIQQLVTLVKNFVAGLDPAVGKCLDGNAEVASLEKYFGFPLDTQKIISYITFHFGAVQKSICAMQNAQKSGDYKGLGTQAGVLAKTIIGIKAEEQLQMIGDDSQTIQLIMNGFFEGLKLTDPTTMVKCIDATSATKIVQFTPQLLDKACKVSLVNIKSLVDFVKKFMDSLPKDIGVCMGKDADVERLKKFFLPIDTSKIIAYVTTHFSSVQKAICDMKNTFNAGQYQSMGTKLADLAKKVTGKGYAYDQNQAQLE